MQSYPKEMQNYHDKMQSNYKQTEKTSAQEHFKW